jgi:hypothetical protein
MLPDAKTGESVAAGRKCGRTHHPGTVVLKGLERIAYETEEDIADFRGRDRHSHITEFLRRDSSLPEAKGLARHKWNQKKRG